MQDLVEKLESKTARVGVVGLGYVGLPLAVEMCKAGYKVTGIDVSEELVESVNAGKSRLIDVSSEELAPFVSSGQLHATTDFAEISELDTISICVPTPLRKTKDPDISYVKAATEAIVEHLVAPALVVLESTTYPGTTDELIVPILTSGGLKVGDDIFVAYSPERVDPGNKVFNTRNTPKVIGGVTPACSEVAEKLYQRVVDTVHVIDSARDAEMVKLLENTFRAVNIALVNEMLLMCDRMDIDVWSVVEAAATKPFGFMPFYPGPGIGGHCIPLDPMYLSWKAKAYDFFNRFIELATDVNGNMPRFVIDKLMRTLNDHEKHVKNSNIMIVGLAYKADINDTRESPGIELFKLLLKAGAKVTYHDAFVDTIEIDGAEYESLGLDQAMLESTDCVIMATVHSELDLELIAKAAPLVLDTRDAFRGFRQPNIVRL